jgi:hypothetical protein
VFKVVKCGHVTYQNALPYSFRSSSFEWFLTVVKALPVAFLWYVFLEESPPWFVSVILYRTGTVVNRNGNCFCNEKKGERMGLQAQSDDVRQERVEKIL